jgi:hypothetical protein
MKVFLLGLLLASPPDPYEPLRDPPLLLRDPAVLTALDTLAAARHTTRESFRVDPAALRLLARTPPAYRMGAYFLEEPLRAPSTIVRLGEEFLRSDLQGVCMVAHHLADGGPAFTDTAAVNAVRGGRDLDEAMRLVYAETGKRFDGRERELFRRQIASLPPPIQRNVAGMLLVAHASAKRRNLIADGANLGRGGLFGGATRRTQLRIGAFLHDLLRSHRDEMEDGSLAEVNHVEFLRWAGGYAHLLSECAEALDPSGTHDEFQYEWKTPFGRVAVGGGGNNVFRGEHLLIVDLGGDDRYEGAGGISGGDVGASYVVDVSGDDLYSYGDSGSAGPGGAILGYAGILDLDGNDVYRTGIYGAGFGAFGVGWVRDYGGDDRYLMHAGGQGAGLFGTGILLDDAGDDVYDLDRDYPWKDLRAGNGQGWGGSTGIGILIDRGGNDGYAPSVSSGPCGEESTGGLAERIQGAGGSGRYDIPGGMGWCIDGSGSDRYSAHLLSQGSGVGGLGVLFDRSGDDTTYARKTSQGYGDSGSGIVVDLTGNDVRCMGDRGLGAGTGLGMGVFFDASGSDRYSVVEDACGFADGGSLGLFVDRAGEDGYEGLRERSAGWGSGRSRGIHWKAVSIPAVGLFLDLEGVDELPIELMESRPGSRFHPPSGEGEVLGGAVYTTTRSGRP